MIGRVIGATMMTICLVTTACVRPAGMHVVAGSSVHDLVFRISALDSARVLPPIDAVIVDGGPLGMGGSRGYRTYAWYLARHPDATDTGSARAEQIRYGEVPPGYGEAAPHLPLLAGQYSVEIRAGRYRARGWFTVTPDGGVVQQSSFYY